MITKEQILAMPAGRELDELIIREVFKFQVVSEGSIFWDKKDAPFPFVMWDETDGWKLYEDAEGEAWSYRPFNPSTDLSAAWEVVEKMQGEWAWTMYMHNIANEVTVRIGGGSFDSKNTPEAICKAAMLNYIKYVQGR